jgi:hypothetical protein
MGLLPHVFPAWFSATGSDASSTRVAWLYVMAATQVGLGLGYIAQAHVIPFAVRLVSAERSVDSGALALSKQRSVSGR